MKINYEIKGGASKMAQINDRITFENPIEDGRYHWQDIVLDGGTVIGALNTFSRGVLNPLTEDYQFAIHEKNIHKINPNYFWNTEDEGYVFVVYDTLQKFFIEEDFAFHNGLKERWPLKGEKT